MSLSDFPPVIKWLLVPVVLGAFQAPLWIVLDPLVVCTIDIVVIGAYAYATALSSQADDDPTNAYGMGLLVGGACMFVGHSVFGPILMSILPTLMQVLTIL